jgi:hypothetical protein
MKAQDAVVAVAKQQGFDEVLVIYTSKLDVREWVALRSQWIQGTTAEPLNVERARSILKEYGQCAIILGKDPVTFAEQMLAIEKELRSGGFYKAWAITNAPLGKNMKMPCNEWFHIDIVATLAKYKKNLQIPMPGDYPPWGIMLLE